LKRNKRRFWNWNSRAEKENASSKQIGLKIGTKESCVEIERKGGRELSRKSIVNKNEPCGKRRGLEDLVVLGEIETVRERIEAKADRCVQNEKERRNFEHWSRKKENNCRGKSGTAVSTHEKSGECRRHITSGRKKGGWKEIKKGNQEESERRQKGGKWQQQSPEKGGGKLCSRAGGPIWVLGMFRIVTRNPGKRINTHKQDKTLVQEE